MLVLTRKQNEMIQIGEDIVGKVISTGKGKVKIGIDAPAEVRVMRGELADEVKAHRLENAVATAGRIQAAQQVVTTMTDALRAAC